MTYYTELLDQVASHFPTPGDICLRKSDGRRCVVVPSAPFEPDRISIVWLDERKALAYECTDWLERFEILQRVER